MASSDCSPQRVDPDGVRPDSSNIDAPVLMAAWSMGSQMVCLNFQTSTDDL
jgi:hypothetical protein